MGSWEVKGKVGKVTSVVMSLTAAWDNLKRKGRDAA